MRLVAIVFIAVVIALFAAHRRSAVAPVDQRRSTGSSAAPATRSTPAPAQRHRSAAVSQKNLLTTDPDYDPVAYVDQEAGAIGAKDVYLTEPRDPRYAPIFESRIDSVLQTVLAELDATKHVKAIHVDCRTLSCSTTVEAAPGTDVHELYNELDGIVMGDAQEPGIDQSDPDHPRVTIFNLYRPASRDDGTFQVILDNGMRPSLDFTKQRLGKPDEAVR